MGAVKIIVFFVLQIWLTWFLLEAVSGPMFGRCWTPRKVNKLCFSNGFQCFSEILLPGSGSEKAPQSTPKMAPKVAQGVSRGLKNNINNQV